MNRLKKEHFFEIVEKFEAGKATPEEVRFLDAYYQSFGLKESFSSKLTTEQKQLLKDEIYSALGKEITEASQTRVIRMPGRLFLRVSAVASVIILMGLVFNFINKPAQDKPKTAQHDIQPADNKAILTLASGKKIVLTDTDDGNITTEGKTVINKASDGRLIYIDKGTKSIAYNSIITPRGGQYNLTLSDGTKVFLNAASSLKYPVAFTGNERLVELRGEAYFEVTRNTAKPFKVKSGDQIVEVLGTHFNVNSYPDEPVTKTTLVEGSVKILAGRQALLLKPGQQSQTSQATSGEIKILLKRDADISGEVAWRNGLFQFKEASIREVMKDAARWYDVDVVYEDDLPAIKVSGRISRKVNLSGLLELMRFAGANVKVEGRQVTISK